MIITSNDRLRHEAAREPRARRVARMITRVVERKGQIPVSAARKAVACRDRDVFDEAVAVAITEGWLDTLTDDRGVSSLRPTGTQPQATPVRAPHTHSQARKDQPGATSLRDSVWQVIPGASREIIDAVEQREWEELSASLPHGVALVGDGSSFIGPADGTVAETDVAAIVTAWSDDADSFWARVADVVGDA